MNLVEQIKTKAHQIGFDLAGVAPVGPSVRADYFRQWLEQGRAGKMHYLSDRVEERLDPTQYFPGARSAICVASNYRVNLHPAPSPGNGRVARYALADDYHNVMTDRLHELADWLRDVVPGTQTRSCVDTAPVMEKELAARAGIGWMGKNTCIMNDKIGSFILLGQILTTLQLPADDPAIDRCATCTRCIDACPTSAITAPYQLDATRCISYLTIENREHIASDLQEKIGDWLYGCDICQDVCPWNRKSPETLDPAFQPHFWTGRLPWREVSQWNEHDYRRELKGSAMKRIKLPVLKRNAQIVGENERAGLE